MYTITINGFEVKVDSAAAAAELLRELAGNVTATPQPKSGLALKTPLNTDNQEHDDINRDAAQTALGFLKAIRQSAPNGATVSDLMVVFGVQNPKAVGARSVAVNRLLQELGYAPKHVYKNPRSATGRTWLPAKAMNAAISTIEQRLAAH